MSQKFEGPYTTEEEIAFLDRMRDEGNATLLASYCGIILRGERRWSPRVDAGEVRRWAAGWIGRPVENSPAKTYRHRDVLESQ